MRKLLVAVPSRGRPHNAARLRDAMRETCTAETTLLIGLDADDPAGGAYPDGPEYVVRSGLRQVVAWINELAVPRTGDYAAIGTIGDDNLPQTRGWDAAILDALERAPFAFGNDLYPYRPPGELCCHVFCRSGVIAALGYLGPPALRHMYVDDVWMAWGRACGIAFLPGVIIRHEHYTTGAAPMDETYARSAAVMAADRAAFGEYREDPAGLAADITRIRGAAARPW